MEVLLPLAPNALCPGLPVGDPEAPTCLSGNGSRAGFGVRPGFHHHLIKGSESYRADTPPPWTSVSFFLFGHAMRLVGA